MTAKLYRTALGATLQVDQQWFAIDRVDWDGVFRRSNPAEWLLGEAKRFGKVLFEGMPACCQFAPPIAGQEVWAAGVTYYRSRTARMEESSAACGSDFYDRVYSAARPELFFKASSSRVVGNGQQVRIRSDSRWNVPEPELALCITSGGRIFGYTIGNDMSSRDIEGENPLYLPQAKVYDGCCALGPGILLSAESLPASTEIGMAIRRNGATVFQGSTCLDRMKRVGRELADYLFRDNTFPSGCFLLTGTGVVPPNDFTLQSGDAIQITIEPIGTLENTVA
jgi:2-dehydro-3-deoxy-D-arabinonate dehydratase